MLVKEDGVLSGLALGLIIIKEVDPSLKVEVFNKMEIPSLREISF